MHDTRAEPFGQRPSARKQFAFKQHFHVVRLARRPRRRRQHRRQHSGLQVGETLLPVLAIARVCGGIGVVGTARDPVVDPLIVVERGFVAEGHLLTAHRSRQRARQRPRKPPPIEDQMVRTEDENVFVVAPANQPSPTQGTALKVVRTFDDFIDDGGEFIVVEHVVVDNQPRRCTEKTTRLALHLFDAHPQHGVVGDDGKGARDDVRVERALQLDDTTDVGHGRVRVQVMQQPEAALDGAQWKRARRRRHHPVAITSDVDVAIACGRSSRKRPTADTAPRTRPPRAQRSATGAVATDADRILAREAGIARPWRLRRHALAAHSAVQAVA